MGIGDRFARQGAAQLKALQISEKKGIAITPVWNKSNREHEIMYTTPEDTRYAADAAVREANWQGQYFVDADHITLANVDRFIDACDYFTLDVAESIGKTAADADIQAFILRNQDPVKIPGMAEPLATNRNSLERMAYTYLKAIHDAALLYQHIENTKGKGRFITEVSMDEVANAQTPADLYFVLKELARLGVPVSAIAPKFTGRFNKGVDYVGDIGRFEREFEENLLVIKQVVKESGLPSYLKLSIHSGSDKFSLYPVMGRLIRKYDAGLHLKTAGTTWLEELTGLALAGGDALEMAKNIYFKSLDRFDELTSPYVTVINIDRGQLPPVQEVAGWTCRQFADALRHDQSNRSYNVHFRQLLHVSYRIAAEYSNIYIHHLMANKELVGQQVSENLYDRHIRRIFEDKH